MKDLFLTKADETAEGAEDKGADGVTEESLGCCIVDVCCLK